MQLYKNTPHLESKQTDRYSKLNGVGLRRSMTSCQRLSVPCALQITGFRSGLGVAARHLGRGLFHIGALTSFTGPGLRIHSA
eukprot:3070298-Amphidinium_carterae.1